MWTPDSERVSEDLVFRTYAGGYEHHLRSIRFGFELIENYTSANGSCVKLHGSMDDLLACLTHYGIKT